MNFAGQNCGEPHLNSHRFKLAVLSALLSTQKAFGASTACTDEPLSQACKLDHTLHVLYWLAGILAVLLTLIVAAAFYIYRRNMLKKLTPDD